MSNLSEYSVQDLCVELRTRGLHGVISVRDQDRSRLDMWWGNLTYCLGMLRRLDSEINVQMDEEEEAEFDEEGEEAAEDLAKDFPQLGQYL